MDEQPAPETMRDLVPDRDDLILFAREGGLTTVRAPASRGPDGVHLTSPARAARRRRWA